MSNKIQAQLLEAKEMKKAIRVTVEVPLGSFKMKDIAFGGKVPYLTIDEPTTQIIEDFDLIRKKAAKWDALDAKIGSYYPETAGQEGEGGDLMNIGEAAAMAFGYL